MLKFHPVFRLPFLFFTYIFYFKILFSPVPPDDKEKEKKKSSKC
jgi:hypothetical protein